MSLKLYTFEAFKQNKDKSKFSVENKNYILK